MDKNDNTIVELYKQLEISRNELNILIENNMPYEMILDKSQQLDKLIAEYQKLILHHDSQSI